MRSKDDSMFLYSATTPGLFAIRYLGHKMPIEKQIKLLRLSNEVPEDISIPCIVGLMRNMNAISRFQEGDYLVFYPDGKQVKVPGDIFEDFWKGMTLYG